MKGLACALIVTLSLGLTARAAESLDDALARASGEYTVRLKQAADELNATRERITAEKAPFLERLRRAEERTIAAEMAATRADTQQEHADEQRKQLLKDLDRLRKNSSYVTTLAHDSLKAFSDSFAPGERQFVGAHAQDLLQRLDSTSGSPPPQTAVDVAEFLLQRTERELGGYAADGNALFADSNEVAKGTFAFVGPETFFRADGKGEAGSVRLRDGTEYAVVYKLPNWKSDDVAAYFSGKDGVIDADASGGRALRLRETTGTVIDHIRKGGIVAYAILLVGLLSLVMIVGKIRDASQLAVDDPETVRAFLHTVSSGSEQESAAALRPLKRATAEVFSVGLTYRDQSKATLEEHLQAVLLRQRLHFERRLPLLAVIATASPLMGLLGTVVGMVKTFALITVFGTGNASKLSSGISEVLVATELGLVVAIPTLVIHGFLSHRIQKQLSLLERYALQFVTAAEAARVSPPNGRATVRV